MHTQRLTRRVVNPQHDDIGQTNEQPTHTGRVCLHKGPPAERRRTPSRWQGLCHISRTANPRSNPKSPQSDGVRSVQLGVRPRRGIPERVIVKNARGHLLHELGEATPAHPKSVAFFPVTRLSPDRRDVFEYIDEGPLLPEVNSRMLQRVLGIEPLTDGWVEVQPDVYRYAVMQNMDEMTVRTLIRDYLATEVVWTLD